MYSTNRRIKLGIKRDWQETKILNKYRLQFVPKCPKIWTYQETWNIMKTEKDFSSKKQVMINCIIDSMKSRRTTDSNIIWNLKDRCSSTTESSIKLDWNLHKSIFFLNNLILNKFWNVLIRKLNIRRNWNISNGEAAYLTFVSFSR